MKRCVAVVALFVTVGSQLAPLGCAMSTTAEHHVVLDRASADHGASGHGSHRMVPAGVPNASDDARADARDGGPATRDCGLLMTCGSAAIEVTTVAVQIPVRPDGADLRAPRAALPAGLSPAADPPPPRALS